MELQCQRLRALEIVAEQEARRAGLLEVDATVNDAVEAAVGARRARPGVVTRSAAEAPARDDACDGAGDRDYDSGRHEIIAALHR